MSTNTPLTIKNLHPMLEHALAAARQAAAHVHNAFRTHPIAEHKGRVDLVTRYDRESEGILRDRLRATSIPVVGEEQGGEGASGKDEPTWYVDPIDGTTNFVHGHPFYCVSVGLLVSGRPVLGVVVAPALGIEWTGFVAHDGLPGRAERNGAPCEVSRVAQFREALLATGFPYDRATSPDNNFDAFVHIKRQCQAVRRCGSAAIDACFVADGTYDGYWEKKLQPWDVAAGAAIVVGAGGRISDYRGDAVDVRKGALLATNGAIHAALVDALATVSAK